MSDEDQLEQPEDQTRAVLTNSSVMAVGTIVSRVTGVLRDIVITAALGSATLADTYALGNSLPNVIYILVVGGALNAVFIPQLVRHMKNDDDGNGYADRLLTLTTMVLVVLSVAAVLAAPWIVRLYATSSFSEHDLNVATTFARYCLPQILFYGLFTMFTQVLQARQKFAAPAFAPIVNNVVMIATALGFIWVVSVDLNVSTVTSTQIAVLGIGTTVGVAAQALVLIPFLARAGYRWRPKFDFRGHGLGKSGSLAGWTIGLVLVNQVGFIIISRLATAANIIASDTSGVAQGLASYQRAYLMFILPHSVITISLVSALLPRMSRAASEGNLTEVGADVAQGMRLISVLLVPCAVVLAAFGPYLGTALLSVGANKGAPATYTGVVVSVFALSLLPFSLFYILLRGWYSVEDTRTPFLVTVFYNIVSIPLMLVLFAVSPDSYKVCAIALGYGLAYWVTLALSWWLLGRRLGGLQTRATVSAVLRMMVAGTVAGLIGVAVAVGGFAVIKSVSLAGAYEAITAERLPSLIVFVVGGFVTLVIYGLTAWLLRISELREIVATVGSRVRRS